MPAVGTQQPVTVDHFDQDIHGKGDTGRPVRAHLLTAQRLTQRFEAHNPSSNTSG